MRPLPALTDRVPLGELRVGPACVGMVEDPDVIAAAFEAGINFFFLSADMHWPLYEATRVGLQRLLAAKPSARDDIVVAAVAYVTQPEFCWAPFEELVACVPALGHLDVLVAGGAGHELGARLKVYEKHRESRFLGAGAIGASFHHRPTACDAIANERVDLAFVRCNPQHPGARSDVYATARSRADGRRCLVFNFKSTIGHLSEADYARLGIGADFWRPHITDYYRFAFTQPAVDGVLCSLPTEQAVRELAEALAKGPLSEDDEQYLIDLGELSSGTARLSDPASSSASRAAS